MLFDSTGRLLIRDGWTGNVRVSSGGPPTLLIDPPGGGWSHGLAIDSDDDIYVPSEDGVVRVYSPDGELIHDAFATGIQDGAHAWLAFTPGGAWGKVLLALDTYELLRIDPGGVISVLGTGFGDANFMTFGPDGALYVSEASRQRVLRITLACPADIVDDDTVDVADLLVLLAKWGPCPPLMPCYGDVNGDRVVDTLDLLDLLAAWGPCP